MVDVRHTLQRAICITCQYFESPISHQVSWNTYRSLNLSPIGISSNRFSCLLQLAVISEWISLVNQTISLHLMAVFVPTRKTPRFLLLMCVAYVPDHSRGAGGVSLFNIGCVCQFWTILTVCTVIRALNSKKNTWAEL